MKTEEKYVRLGKVFQDIFPVFRLYHPEPDRRNRDFVGMCKIPFLRAVQTGRDQGFAAESSILFDKCLKRTGRDRISQEWAGICCEELKEERRKEDMEQYKQEFIEFMVDSQALKFGEFTLKSGRKSPFFMNAGSYVTGAQLRKLGEYYARAIHDRYGDDFDVLFGPAYKGIPLSVAAAIAYSGLYGREVRYCSNRKEAKDHGDAGILLGSGLKDGDRVIIIEDVTTSGKSIEETYPIIKAQARVEIVGLMVSLNRMEKGPGGKMSALAEIREKYGIEAHAIITMQDVTEHLYNKPYKGQVYIDDELKSALDEYYKVYGA